MHYYTTSWDDADELNVEVAELLSLYAMPGTFYINGPHTDYDCYSLVEKLNNMGFEVGGHTQHHPTDIKKLDHKKKLAEITNNKKWLEAIVEKPVVKFAYPKGKYDADTIRVLKDAGYKLARTVDVMSIDYPNNNFKVKTTFHIHPYRKEYGGRYFLDVGKQLVDKWVDKGGRLEIWGHAMEIEKFSIWNETRELFEYLRDNKPKEAEAI